jgi:hypothetical protein
VTGDALAGPAGQSWPDTTYYNHVARWRRACVWTKIEHVMPSHTLRGSRGPASRHLGSSSVRDGTVIVVEQIRRCVKTKPSWECWVIRSDCWMPAARREDSVSREQRSSNFAPCHLLGSALATRTLLVVGPATRHRRLRDYSPSRKQHLPHAIAWGRCYPCVRYDVSPMSRVAHLQNQKVRLRQAL